jgi:Raf kinase inhibitor-like YbhB/YbcL family protein
MITVLKKTTTALFVSAISLSAMALELKSEDISEGQPLAKTFEFAGFGCDGANLSPQLSWSEAPKGTKSFAITAYDPDAPTGSGWRHWMVTDISADTFALERGAGSSNKTLPKGSKSFVNDYGAANFGGACPPQGHGMHRYQFNVWALSVESIDLPDNASGALVGYMLNANVLEKATLTATYSR